jgi:ABC-type transport system involved in cytochrome c biogenesis permease subunit
MLWPLLIMIVAYQLLFFAILLTGIRSELLQREKSSRWVNDLLATGVIGEGVQ